MLDSPPSVGPCADHGRVDAQEAEDDRVLDGWVNEHKMEGGGFSGFGDFGSEAGDTLDGSSVLG
jgi:hypothetical protein